MRRVVLVVAAVVVAISTACSREEPSSDIDPAFDERLADYLEHAPGAGASEEQIAILEEARQTGDIPFDVYNAAMDRALRCLRDAGFDIDDWGVRSEDFGYPRRHYGIPLGVEDDPNEMRELWPGTGVEEHRCFAEHSSWVQFAYDAQPSSVEAQDAQFEPYREAVIECMEEHGVEFDHDMSRQELMQAMADAWQDGTTSVDCFNESGYSGG